MHFENHRIRIPFLLHLLHQDDVVVLHRTHRPQGKVLEKAQESEVSTQFTEIPELLRRESLQSHVRYELFLLAVIVDMQYQLFLERSVSLIHQRRFECRLDPNVASFRCPLFTNVRLWFGQHVFNEIQSPTIQRISYTGQVFQQLIV